MHQPKAHNRKIQPLAGLLAMGLILSATPAGAVQGEGKSAPTATAAVPATSHKARPARKTSPYRPSVPASAKSYHQAVWGIDNLLVRQTASGNLIRFSYRVTNPAQAKALNDQHATPYLIGIRSRAMLQVPVMDKVGKLRQTGLPEAGKEYWMVFSNKGNLVKRGDRVNVVIGTFHADGLMVE